MLDGKLRLDVWSRIYSYGHCARDVCICVSKITKEMWDRGHSWPAFCQLCFYSLSRKRRTAWVLTQALIGIMCCLFFPLGPVCILSIWLWYSWSFFNKSVELMNMKYIWQHTLFYTDFNICRCNSWPCLLNYLHMSLQWHICLVIMIAYLMSYKLILMTLITSNHFIWCKF